MPHTAPPEILSRPEGLSISSIRAVRALGFCAVGITIFGLYGWWCHHPLTYTWLPGYASMKPTTARSILFIAVAILLQFRRRTSLHVLAMLLGSLAFVLSFGSLIEYVFHVNLGIDQIILAVQPDRFGDPAGRMSMATSVALSSTSLASLLLRRAPRPAVLLLLLGTFVSTSALVGYFFHVGPQPNVLWFRSFAIPTVVGLLCIQLAGLLSMPGQEPLRSLLAPFGQRSRRAWLLASVTLLPILLALPVLAGLHRGLFDTPFALAVLVVVLMAIQTLVLWRDNVTLAGVEARRAHAELALLQNEKLAAVGRLSASIAHEINNPLEAVNNLLYLIRSSDSTEQMVEYAALAEEELQRVTQITTQTLSFYKESRTPAPCFPDDLVNSSIKLLTTRINGSGATLSTDHRGPARAIVCKDGELRQVLINLISNATDAAPRGRIRVRVHTSRWWKPGGADGVRILVADNGSGIAPEHRARVFEPFFTTKADQGNGLGLWVARNLIEAHGGFLKVRSSTRPGGSGTVFCLFLPS